MLKLCGKRNHMKDKSEFHKNKNTKDGLCAICKDCDRASTLRYRADKEPSYRDPCIKCKFKQKCIDEKLMCKALVSHFKGEKVINADIGNPTAEIYDKEFKDAKR